MDKNYEKNKFYMFYGNFVGMENGIQFGIKCSSL